MIVVVGNLALYAETDFAVAWHGSAVVSMWLVDATQVAVVVWRSCLDGDYHRHVCCHCSLRVISIQLDYPDFGYIPCRYGWIAPCAKDRAWIPSCTFGDSPLNHALGDSSCSCILGDSSCRLGESSCNRSHHYVRGSDFPCLCVSHGNRSSHCFIVWLEAFKICVRWQSDASCACSTFVDRDALLVLHHLVLSCAEIDCKQFQSFQYRRLTRNTRWESVGSLHGVFDQSGHIPSGQSCGRLYRTTPLEVLHWVWQCCPWVGVPLHGAAPPINVDGQWPCDQRFLYVVVPPGAK